MSTEERQRVEPRTDEHHQVIDEPEAREHTEKPDVTDEHKAAAKKMFDAYEEDRPTVTMPGTGGTVAGTAVNDWLDDDGKPKFSDTSKDQG
jgi:hypothetical protein